MTWTNDNRRSCQQFNYLITFRHCRHGWGQNRGQCEWTHRTSSRNLTTWESQSFFSRVLFSTDFSLSSIFFLISWLFQCFRKQFLPIQATASRTRRISLMLLHFSCLLISLSEHQKFIFSFSTKFASSRKFILHKLFSSILVRHIWIE